MSATSSPLSPVPQELIVKSKQKYLRTLVIYVVLITLLYFALRNAPFVEIWSALKQLQLWQIATLLIIDALIYALITLRWWIIVRAETKAVPYIPLLAVRVAVFGVSYFTLGPQVGGEPLQVFYLQRNYGITYTRATASALMDKLLEFLANFLLLAVGLTAVLRAGILDASGSSSLVSLIGLVILFAWPPIHIILMIHGKYPVSAILRRITNKKFARFIFASERMAGAFCRRHLFSLLAALAVSVLAAVGMVTEFFLITTFLQIDLSLSQTIAAWTAGWLAFLVPVPAGLGALEASQVFAFGVFGISAASAISVAFWMRGRDLLIGGLGLLFAGRLAGK